MTFQQFENTHLQIRASRIPILKALLFSLFAPCIKFNITIYIGIQCLCYFVRKWGYSCRYKFLLKIIVLYQQLSPHRLSVVAEHTKYIFQVIKSQVFSWFSDYHIEQLLLNACHGASCQQIGGNSDYGSDREYGCPICNSFPRQYPNQIPDRPHKLFFSDMAQHNVS